MNDLSDRQIATSRLIAHPPERVYAAFSDPVRLARWWGPKDFRNTFQAFDLRAGGVWRFVMHGPDGTDYPNESVFIEVVPNRQVVLRHVSRPHFEMFLSFAEEGRHTRLGWRQVFNTAEECARVSRIVTEANEQNLDRLEVELAAA